MNGVHIFGVVGLMAAYKAGRLTPEAVVTAYFERIAKYDRSLNCYTALDRERALAGARAARMGDTMRPLEGVPIAVKANIAVAGLATTAGIAALGGDIASEDAEVVRRLRDAGAIILGHVNMDEAALGATTDNAHFGATQNPWKAGYTPGGSSGGSGAAVAAGLCAAALGTDTLGSVRIPAAYCGVYGLKPTNGLVPDDGLVPLSRRLDAIGALARSLADVAAVMAAMAPLSPAERIGKVAKLDIVDGTGADVRRAYNMAVAVDLIEAIGVRVQAYDGGDLDLTAIRTAGFIEAACDAKAFFADRLASNPAGFSAAFTGLLGFAGRFDAPALAAGRAALDRASRLLRSILADADAIILPTTPQAAFAHTAQPPVTQADFTALANIAGLPAISIPAGWTAEGLPVGVQLIGRANGERTLIDLAARLDAVFKGYAMPSGYD